MKHIFLSVLLVAASTFTFGQSQLKLPTLSPNAKVSQDFSVSNIEISYSRPSMRGRKWDPLESTCRHASLSIL